MTTVSKRRVIWLTTQLIIFFAVHVVSAQSNVLYFSDPPKDFGKSGLAKTMLESDMNYWQQVMEESHVNPYHAISRAGLVKLKKEILKDLPDTISHFQASLSISRLIGALSEGHLGFAGSRHSDSLYAYHCIRFPYILYNIDQDGFIIQRDLSKANRLTAFNRIISVNNVPVQQLYDRYSRFYGGLEEWKRLMVKNNIRKLLYMDGIVSPFIIKAISNQDTIQFTTDGYSKQEADSISRILVAEQSPYQPFSLRFLSNNIAMIEFNNMNGSLRDSFSVFLRRTFKEIRQRNAAGVIIDIRKNGGGDSGLGDTLISYISGKPYQNVSGMKMRISKHSKAFAELQGTKDPFKDWKNGRLYTYKSKSLLTPVENPLRFQGRVAVIIGPGTFSSANMLTNAIKDFQLATLIGEPTAEPGNDFGEIFSFMLPNTRIVATAAIKMFIRANGDERDFNGIQPDIKISNSLSDTQNKKDRAVERAAEWILK